MENKVYYGEYSLKHWVDMMLKQNIKLPDYQRSFVWDETRVMKLIKSFKEKQFVPPVTIGSITLEDGTIQNLILDGQQRLTSIFLAYLSLFPNKDAFKSEYEASFNENDDIIDEDEIPQNKIIEWTFRNLLELGNNKEKITSKIENTKYKAQNFNIESIDELFENSFLGFSFLVPADDNFTLQQKYYSTVFRDINIEGVRLIAQESRKSLYFLNSKLPDFFEPKFCGLFRLNKTKLDLVRYLSLLSQYKKDAVANRVAQGYKLKMEKYYENFIYLVVNKEINDVFCDMSNIAKPNVFSERYKKFITITKHLDFSRDYTSIIDIDMYLFGSLYLSVFLNKSIKQDKSIELKTEIEKAIVEFKGVYNHTKTPSALKYLRARISKSIEIFNRYKDE